MMELKILELYSNEDDITSLNKNDFIIINSNNNETIYDNNFDMTKVNDDDDEIEVDDSVFLNNKIKKKRGRKPKLKLNNDSENISSDFNTLSIESSENNISSTLTSETSENIEDKIIMKKKRGRPRKCVENIAIN